MTEGHYVGNPKILNSHIPLNFLGQQKQLLLLEESSLSLPEALQRPRLRQLPHKVMLPFLKTLPPQLIIRVRA